MDAAVDFGVVVGALGHAKEGVDFRQDYLERAAIAQNFYHDVRLRLHQPFGQLLPHTFGHERTGFAGGHHVAHQLQGFGGNGKTIAGGKAGSAQNAHRVFGKSGRHMAQQAQLQIAAAVERVDNLPVGVLRHGVDAEVAPRQILLQRDIGRGVESKAGIAFGGFALGARQRVFFVALRMQKHRKIFAHRPIARREHGIGIGAHHHPIAIGHRPPQQGIAYSAANKINLHDLRPSEKKQRLF